MYAHIHQLNEICDFVNDYSKSHHIYNLFPTIKWRSNEILEGSRFGGEYFTYVDSGVIECIPVEYNKITKLLNCAKSSELKIMIDELDRFFNDLFEMLFVKFPNHAFEQLFAFNTTNGKHTYNTTVIIEYLDPNTCHKFERR
jgi:hypothetical protein